MSREFSALSHWWSVSILLPMGLPHRRFENLKTHNFCSLCHNYTSIYPLFFILCDYSLVLLMFRGLQIEAHILKVDFAITPSEMRVNTAVELNIQYNNILLHILIFSTFLLHLCMHSIKFYNYWEKCLLPQKWNL